MPKYFLIACAACWKLSPGEPGALLAPRAHAWVSRVRAATSWTGGALEEGLCEMSFKKTLKDFERLSSLAQRAMKSHGASAEAARSGRDGGLHRRRGVAGTCGHRRVDSRCSLTVCLTVCSTFYFLPHSEFIWSISCCFCEGASSVICPTSLRRGSSPLPLLLGVRCGLYSH